MIGLDWVRPDDPVAQQLRDSGVGTSLRENPLMQREPSQPLPWFPPTCTGKTPPQLIRLLPKRCRGVCLGMIDLEPDCPPLVACPRSIESGTPCTCSLERRLTCDFEHNVVAPLYQSATGLPRPRKVDHRMLVGMVEDEPGQSRPNEEFHRFFLYCLEFHHGNQPCLIN